MKTDFHSFLKYLLSNCKMLLTVLSMEDPAVNRTDKTQSLQNLHPGYMLICVTCLRRAVVSVNSIIWCCCLVLCYGQGWHRPNLVRHVEWGGRTRFVMLMANRMLGQGACGGLLMTTVELIIEPLVSVFKISKVFSWGITLGFLILCIVAVIFWC